jgi:hypothetical protein
MTPDSRRSFDWRKAARAIRRPIVLIVAVQLIACAGLVWANVHLRGRPENLTPVFFERLGNIGFVRLYGEGSDFWPGNVAWIDGHPEAAIREWSKVVEKEGATETSLFALMNIGDVSLASGDRKQAIAAYTKAVDLPVPRQPRTSAWEPWHNEKHQACATLSDTFLDSLELDRALKYAELARGPHAVWSPCGVANSSEDSAFERRIADIRTAIAEQRPILVETLNQASISRFQQPLAAVQRAELRRLRQKR